MKLTQIDEGEYLCDEARGFKFLIQHQPTYELDFDAIFEFSPELRDCDPDDFQNWRVHLVTPDSSTEFQDIVGTRDAFPSLVEAIHAIQREVADPDSQWFR